VRAAILALLAERPMHGYEMISEVADRTRGGWVPSPGSVYPALQLLAGQGLVAGEADGGRRCYALTEAGRTAVAGAGPPPWAAMTARGDALDARLRDVAAKADAALAHVRSAGTADQKARAIEVMTQARHALYRVLVDDD
jgi:DNA-binding PadR family transcriptional regulator